MTTVITRRPHVVGWTSLILAVGFALVALPVLTADRWIGARITQGARATITVRVPPFFTGEPEVGERGSHEWQPSSVLIARGDVARSEDVVRAEELAAVTPRGPLPYLALFVVIAVFVGLFSHHVRRTARGRLVRVQVVNLALIAVLIAIVKLAMLLTPSNILVVPVAVLALVPTLVTDRIVGLATGTLAALLVALCVPFDVGVALLLLVQVATAGLMIGERPKKRMKTLLVAGGTATVLTALTYPVLQYLTAGRVPFAELSDPTRSAWIATTLGPVIATVLAAVVVPVYQLLVGEITEGTLIELADLAQPLLKQIAEKAPGTWQHSLMMANMAELAANAIGANGRLVRVGAYYHDLGKSLAPKYFVENLEPGETSPHDKLAPDASSEAIFAHVTEGVAAARKAGLHERIVDFMHMHHGNAVLEHFWAKCQADGNPKRLTAEAFRYPGVPPQTRETAILAICDAVEAASRTIKKAQIDSVVQRIVYGKLHLGQLDEADLSMGDLRRIADSLRDTIQHANHGRVEVPRAEQSASATPAAVTGGSAPALDSLDRSGTPDAIRAEARSDAAATDEVSEGLGATPMLRRPPGERVTGPQATLDNELANSATSPIPLLEKKRPSAEHLPVTGRESTQPLDVAMLGVGAALVSEEDRSSRDARREADRLAMAQRYAVEPSATRDSGHLTKQFDRESDPPAGEPRSVPSDGTVVTSARPDKRTNEPATRRSSGDFADRAPPDTRTESDQFAAEAVRALAAAAPDLDVLPPRLRDDSTGPALRKRAATIPPTPELLRPPTVQSPRRAPTVRPPTQPPPDLERGFGKTLSGSADVRPPARPAQPDDAATTLPAMAVINPTELLAISDFHRARSDAAVTKPHPKQAPDDADSSTTRPAMPRAARGTDEPDREDESDDDTRPGLQLPLPAPAMSNPSLDLGDLGGLGDLISPPPPTSDRRVAPPRSEQQTTWARGLASRIDASVDEFSQDTPARPPTRGELQASSDVAPDATRQQSIEEIERLAHSAVARRSSEELELPRRGPYPTAEVSEDDIEAAIEIAPSARRTGSIPIGIAKKKPPTE